MPRLTAGKPMVAGTAQPRTAAARPRAAKKRAAMPDRLSAQALFFRRVRRSLRPGLWILGALVALVLGSELFRELPAIPPVVSPAGSIRHGFADIAAYAGFRVANIEIDGAETTDPDAIRAALGIRDGDPILGVSLAAMRARVEQLGPVQTATVERELPGTLIVRIVERAAFAIWQTGGGKDAKFVLIDAQGNVIADQDAAAAKRRNPALLLLVGADAPQNAQTLVTELKASPSVDARVIAAERVDGLRWNLVLKDQALVKLPADDEAQAVMQLAALQTSMFLLDRPVEVIDLRLPGRLVVRPYPAPAATPNPKVPHDGV